MKKNLQYLHYLGSQRHFSKNFTVHKFDMFLVNLWPFWVIFTLRIVYKGLLSFRRAKTEFDIS